MRTVEQIAKSLGGAFSTGKGRWNCRCPAHNDSRASLSLGPGKKEGRIAAKCFAGCSTSDVLRAMVAVGAIEPLVGGKVGSVAPAPVIEEKPVEPDALAMRIWRGAMPAAGTRAEEYLANRALPGKPPRSLRYHPAARYSDHLDLPAMVACIQRGDGLPIAVQCTFLHPTKPEKAVVTAPRKIYGQLGDGAIRLGPAAPVMGIAEGCETSLAASRIFKMPVWSATGSALHRVAIPPICRELHLFLDSDEPGQRAGARFLAANVDAPFKIITHTPTVPGADWNDIAKLIQSGEK